MNQWRSRPMLSPEPASCQQLLTAVVPEGKSHNRWKHVKCWRTEIRSFITKSHTRKMGLKLVKLLRKLGELVALIIGDKLLLISG